MEGGNKTCTEIFKEYEEIMDKFKKRSRRSNNSDLLKRLLDLVNGYECQGDFDCDFVAYLHHQYHNFYKECTNPEELLKNFNDSTEHLLIAGRNYLKHDRYARMNQFLSYGEDIENAIQCFHEAIDMALKANKINSAVKWSIEIGKFLKNSGNWIDALEFFHLALENSKNLFCEQIIAKQLAVECNIDLEDYEAAFEIIKDFFDFEPYCNNALYSMHKVFTEFEISRVLLLCVVNNCAYPTKEDDLKIFRFYCAEKLEDDSTFDAPENLLISEEIYWHLKALLISLGNLNVEEITKIQCLMDPALNRFHYKLFSVLKQAMLDRAGLFQ